MADEIDFIEDEEESGIDFTPDAAPAVATAPRPIIAPDEQLIAQSDKKADLFAAQQKARQQGAYWEGVANRLGQVSQIINPWASTPENPLGGIGSALKGAGRIVAPVTEASGNVAVGLASDIGGGGIQIGSFPNVSAALTGQHVGNVNEDSPLGARIAEGTVRGAGQMAPALAAAAAGVPAPAAFGGQMGLTEMGTSGDIGKALVQTAVGTGLGKVAEIGTTGGGLLASRVAARVPAALEKPIVAAGEFAGRQALQNVLMTAGNLPEIVKAYQEDPAKGAAMLAEQIGVNLAFEASHLPKTIRESIAKDQATAWLKDPQYLNRVDAETTRQAQAMRAPVIVPESLRELAKEPSTIIQAANAPGQRVVEATAHYNGHDYEVINGHWHVKGDDYRLNPKGTPAQQQRFIDELDRRMVAAEGFELPSEKEPSTTGTPNAIQERQTTEVYGGVPEQPEINEGGLPAAERY